MALLLSLSAALLLAAYAGYPLAMMLRARAAPRPLRMGGEVPARWSVIVCARDEAAVIGRKLASVLAEAPGAEVIVVDDGSRDGTAEAAARPGVRVIARPVPGGKAAALACGAAAATGEILVLTDARQPLAPGSIAALLAPFSDPTVGAVSGELALPAQKGALGLYRRMDDALRRAEAASGSSVGVTGALWALRRGLFVAPPPGLILDDLFLPLWVARMGFRVVVAPNARAFDEASPDPARERRRRTRTLAGNFQLLGACPWLLLPGRNPLLLRLVGHKLLRLVAPLALAGVLVASVGLWPAPVAVLALVGQGLLYGLAAAASASWFTRVGGPIGMLGRACHAFVLLHAAVVLGAYHVLRGREGRLWRDGEVGA